MKTLKELGRIAKRSLKSAPKLIWNVWTGLAIVFELVLIFALIISQQIVCYIIILSIILVVFYHIGKIFNRYS